MGFAMWVGLRTAAVSGVVDAPGPGVLGSRRSETGRLGSKPSFPPSIGAAGGTTGCGEG